MNRPLIIIGLIIIAVGLLWPWLSRLPFGQLPGDIAVRREGFSFFFPITTMILVSVVLSGLLWWLNR